MTRCLPTSIDVARRAGVSQSAVSRAFTPGASVSARTRERVLRAAEELGYRPNVLARSLITGRSRMIGLVVAHLDNQFYPAAIEKLSRALQARGYHVLIFLAPNDADSLDPVLEQILDYQVDGVVMGSCSISGRLAARCESAGTPVMLFNRYQDTPPLSAVVSDNFAGARAAAEHFVAAGHRRIAHIAGSQDSSTGRDRQAGFAAGLAAHGLALEAYVDAGFRRDAAAAATREIFGGTDRPDAVFVGNDQMAFAVMDTLRQELGLDVPGDVAVIGYDDVPMAGWLAYQLTTLRQDADRMIAATVDGLLARIAGTETSPRRQVMASPLVVRGSTRPIPGAG